MLEPIDMIVFGRLAFSDRLSQSKPSSYVPSKPKHLTCSNVPSGTSARVRSSSDCIKSKA